MIYTWSNILSFSFPPQKCFDKKKLFIITDFPDLTTAFNKIIAGSSGSFSLYFLGKGISGYSHVGTLIFKELSNEFLILLLLTSIYIYIYKNIFLYIINYMISLMNIVKEGSVYVQLRNIKEKIEILEKELNEISKILNLLSLDINKYLQIILKNKSQTILNEK